MKPIKRHRKLILTGIALLAILALAVTLAYKVGVKQGSRTAKSKAVMQWPDASKLKPSAQQKNTIGSRSSGFFRLNGVVQSRKKDGFTIKLTDGTVVALAITEKTRYFTDDLSTTQPTINLKTGTPVIVVGTIGATGTFGATTIQNGK